MDWTIQAKHSSQSAWRNAASVAAEMTDYYFRVARNGPNERGQLRPQDQTSVDFVKKQPTGQLLKMKVATGSQRSIEQNKLQRMWINEAADQLKEDTAEGYRAFCKLHFGVPILRNEKDGYQEKYDLIFKPLPYETKLALMAIPFDFAVTREMTKGQKMRYLDDIYQHFTALGAQLTEPSEGMT